MKQYFLLSAALIVTLTSNVLNLKPTAKLERVAAFPDNQVTGVAVSKTGRIFVTFPHWADKHTLSVAEVNKDGSWTAYPNAGWNAKEGAPGQRFICVQSVFVDASDTLWVLDPASIKMEGVTPGGAKLVKIDFTTNQAVQTYSFDDTIAPGNSYLNDVRVDTATNHAFITDSGTGALIVLDLKSGKARRVLGGHSSTKAEPEVELIVDGFKLIDPKTQKPPQIQADGIALDKAEGFLYYHALTGHTLYRIPVAALVDPLLGEEELAAKVQAMGSTPAPDGMIEHPQHGLYLTAIELNAVNLLDPATGTTEVIIQDPRLQWPDSLSVGPDGSIYVTTSQIHRMPKYHGGKSEQSGPFGLYRIRFEVP